MSDLIEINVETTYLSSESNPDENKYYFLYTVLINCLLYTSDAADEP